MLPPHELKNKTFGKTVRGYNPAEVDEYIEFLTQKYTELYRENDELERKLKAAITRLDELKSDEDSIRSTLIDAKRAANKIKADAKERADAIVRSAKASCDTILADFNTKIELGRDTIAALQNDAFDLKQELFTRYSEHIKYLETLTEGFAKTEIPETSVLHKKAVDGLKGSISAKYDVDTHSTDGTDTEQLVDDVAEGLDYDVTDKVDDEYEPMDIVTTAASETDEADAEDIFEIKREPIISSKQSIKGSIADINRQYREASGDAVVNTPDSDTDEDGYEEFLSAVTGKSTQPSKKEQDFDFLFSGGKNKK